MNSPQHLIHCDLLVDGLGRWSAPGAVLFQGDAVIATGTPTELGTPLEAHFDRLDGAAIMPGLVNAHAHLDLSLIGPLDGVEDFTEFAGVVMAHRPLEDRVIAEAMNRGISQSRAGGTLAIGDIAGGWSLQQFASLQGSPLIGVSFLELLAIGSGQDEGLRRVAELLEGVQVDAHGVRLGLQPHAPYSCSRQAYQWCASQGLPLSTHLAEMPEEEQFIRHGSGMFASYLQKIGRLDAPPTGLGISPIEFVLDAVPSVPLIAAHVNHPSEEDLGLLADSSITVAYCPRASSFLGHDQHQWSTMAGLGISVALGTDSVLCTGRDDRLSILDEMQLLHQRHGTSMEELMPMATINGARALGLPIARWTLEDATINDLLVLGSPRGFARPVDCLERSVSIQWLAEDRSLKRETT